VGPEWLKKGFEKEMAVEQQKRGTPRKTNLNVIRGFHTLEGKPSGEDCRGKKGIR